MVSSAKAGRAAPSPAASAPAPAASHCRRVIAVSFIALSSLFALGLCVPDAVQRETK
jgi:hypothetical protein